MATVGISAALAVRSNAGLELWSSAGLTEPCAEHRQFDRIRSKSCRAITFSRDGRYMAWIDGETVDICSTTSWQVVRSLPRPKACYLMFSPAGNYLMTYEPFFTTKDNPKGSPNLFVYDANTGELAYSVIQKKQAAWQPVWSHDESLMALMQGGEAFFFEPNSEAKLTKHCKKIGSARNCVLSVAPNTGPNPYVAFCALPVKRGEISNCKIYRYPDLQAAQPIAFRSFFQADSVDMMWNRRGTSLLLMTSTDVDQTGASYYGRQGLHVMSTDGNSFSVEFNKKGSVHAVAWNPNSIEFCVTYGFMPASTTFYNVRGEIIHQAGEGDKNSIYYNPFGTLVILAGFGNLSGRVDIWDVKLKKEIASLRAPDTTQLEWCPDGELFVTATTAPRLRVGNCFKVWHYSGALLHEIIWPVGQELYEVQWQFFAANTFAVQPISAVKVAGITSSQPVASTVAYRPPGARGINIPPMSLTGAKQSNNNHNNNRRPQSGGGAAAAGAGAGAAAENDETAGGGSSQRIVRRADRNRVRAANFRKKMENGADNTENGVGGGDDSNGPADNQAASPSDAAVNGTVISNGNDNSKPAAQPAVFTQEQVIRFKRIRSVTKRLNDIAKLKSRRMKGEQLEINQVTKINSELELQKELAELKLGA